SNAEQEGCPTKSIGIGSHQKPDSFLCNALRSWPSASSHPIQNQLEHAFSSRAEATKPAWIHYGKGYQVRREEHARPPMHPPRLDVQLERRVPPRIRGYQEHRVGDMAAHEGAPQTLHG